MQRKNSSRSRAIPIILVFLLMLGLFAVIIYFSGIFYFNGMFPCAPPPWVVVDGVAEAKVYAFYDANQNAQPDEGERSLPFIVVGMGEKSAQTNEKGEARILLFKENCACKCSRGEALRVQLPEGWQTTTPLEFVLTGREDVIQLGFYR